MSDTFTVVGVRFSVQDWVPITGHFLIIIGVAVTLYVALFMGSEPADNTNHSVTNKDNNDSTAENNPSETTPKKSPRGIVLFMLHQHVVAKPNGTVFHTSDSCKR